MAGTTHDAHRGAPRWRGAAARTAVLGAALLAAVTTVSACSGGSDSSSPKSTHSTSGAQHGSGAPAGNGQTTSPAPVAKALISFGHLKGDTVNPASPVSVKAEGGTLSSVTLLNAEGTRVKGAWGTGRAAWTNAEDLGYSKTYTLKAVAKNSQGVETVKQTSFTTLTPDNMTMPYMDYMGGYAMQNGAKYGIGIVPMVHFDEVIPDKATAEKALSVTTSPHVSGSWYWGENGQDVYFRPQKFWKPGTQVTINANVYGVEVGPGLYGQSDQTMSFVIGKKQYAIADDTTHMVSVYQGSTLVRTMPTSMGRGGYLPGKNGPISLWTMNGVYTVLEKDTSVIMSSDSYGLPATSPGGYAPESIPWATKISTDGIYLHELDTTVWAQGNTDTSHGCLNLNGANAQWYQQQSQIGDPVTVKNTGGPTIAMWQGGAWSVPWSTWTAGSALHH